MINCLRSLFNTFGKPTEIISDRDIVFTGKFGEFVNEPGIKHRIVGVVALAPVLVILLNASFH